MRFLSGNKNIIILLLLNFLTFIVLLTTNIFVVKNIYEIKISHLIKVTVILLVILTYYYSVKIINRDFTNKGFCYLLLSTLLFYIIFFIIAKITRVLNDNYFLNELYYQWEGMCKAYITAASFSTAAFVKENSKKT